MGESTEIDPVALRASASRFLDAADAIAEVSWPTLRPDELSGSSVAAAVAPNPLAARQADVVAAMRSWALAASGSADAFERADHDAADLLDRR